MTVFYPKYTTAFWFWCERTLLRCLRNDTKPLPVVAPAATPKHSTSCLQQFVRLKTKDVSHSHAVWDTTISASSRWCCSLLHAAASLRPACSTASFNKHSSITAVLSPLPFNQIGLYLQSIAD